MSTGAVGAVKDRKCSGVIALDGRNLNVDTAVETIVHCCYSPHQPEPMVDE